MGKFLEYEVVSPVEIVYPADFHVVAEKIGETVFSVPTRSEVRMWSSGATYSANKNFYHAVEPEKLRYYHYTKVEKNLGTRSLDFMDLNLRFNASLLVDNFIGTENLVDLIIRQLREETGHCSLDGTEHEFEYIDFIDSEKRDNTKLFVLKQFTGLRSVNPLRTITETAKDKIKSASAGLRQVDFTTESLLADSIVIGWVENPSNDAVEEFKETLTERFKDRGYIQVRVKGLEINTAS